MVIKRKKKVIILDGIERKFWPPARILSTDR
jgi:hypothetical protein